MTVQVKVPIQSIQDIICDIKDLGNDLVSLTTVHNTTNSQVNVIGNPSMDIIYDFKDLVSDIVGILTHPVPV